MLMETERYEINMYNSGISLLFFDLYYFLFQILKNHRTIIVLSIHRASDKIFIDKKTKTNSCDSC
jgi:hypothetical protein